MNNLNFDLIIQKDQYKKLNDQTVQNILMPTNLIKISYLNTEYNKARRICLFGKIKKLLT